MDSAKQKRTQRSASQNPRARSGFNVEALEPRLLLSGDPLATLSTALLLQDEADSSSLIQQIETAPKIVISLDGWGDTASENAPPTNNNSEDQQSENSVATETALATADEPQVAEKTGTIAAADRAENPILIPTSADVESTSSDQLVETLHAANAPPQNSNLPDGSDVLSNSASIDSPQAGNLAQDGAVVSALDDSDSLNSSS
ncbi:MAG TPA: LEPR-XLL domain-containing protein, partial [Terriglobia bacterium]|nr:LEPR-XLL domain-containing protein [Terriglobia bacterium]